MTAAQEQQLIKALESIAKSLEKISGQLDQRTKPGRATEEPSEQTDLRV